MKKTILSLTAVLTMFANAPTINAAPVVDSASEVSVSSVVSHSVNDITMVVEDGIVFKNGSHVREGTSEFEKVMQNKQIKKFYDDSKKEHAMAMKKLTEGLESSPKLRLQMDFLKGFFI